MEGFSSGGLSQRGSGLWDCLSDSNSHVAFLRGAKKYQSVQDFPPVRTNPCPSHGWRGPPDLGGVGRR